MSDNTTRLITELVLKDNFTSGAHRVKQSADDLTKSIDGLQSKLAGSAGGGAGSTAASLGLIGAGATGLRRLFSTPQLLGAIGAVGALSFNSMIRSLSGVGGVISSLLSFFPRLISSMMSLLSVVALLIPKFGIFVALGLQILRIPFEILGSILSAVGQAVEKLISVLSELAKTILSVLGAILGSIAKAIGGISMSAIEVSTTFDTLRRMMAGFLGGRIQGEQGARFLQAYGLISPFEQQPLFESARTLLTLGLKLDRFLPVVERLALFAGGTPEALREITDLLMRAIGGQTALVFGSRGLGRFGINRDILRQAGASFDAQGQFQGDARKAIEVFERLSEIPFIVDIADFMRESNVVAFSNALDSINAVLIEIGDKLNAIIVPLVRKGSELIINLVRGGFIDKLIQSVSKVFSPNLGDGWDILEQAIKSIAAALLSVVDITKVLFVQLPDIWKRTFDLLIVYATNAINFVFHTIKKAFIELNAKILSLIPFIGKGLAESLRSLVAPYEPVDPSDKLQALTDALSSLGASVSDIFDANKKVVEELIGAGKKVMSDISDPSQQRLITEFDELVETSKGIERNTERLVDMQSHILGGGDVGRLGITPIEMRNINRSVNININANDSDYAKFLLPIIRDAIIQYEKQRRLGFQR